MLRRRGESCRVNDDGLFASKSASELKVNVPRLLIANLWGVLMGEWKLTGVADRLWMVTGLAVLLVAIFTLGWSSALV